MPQPARPGHRDPTTALLLPYLQAHGGEVVLRAVLDRADVGDVTAPDARPLDRAGRARLVAAVAAVCGADALVGAGVSGWASGLVRDLFPRLRGVRSPRLALRALAAADDVAPGARLEVVAATPTAATVRVAWADDAAAGAGLCDLVRGILTGVPLGWGLPGAVVEHPLCQADGAEACVLRLTWHRATRPRPTAAADAPGHQDLVTEHDALAVARARALQAAAAELVSTSDPDRLADRVVDDVVRVGAVRGAVLVLDDETVVTGAGWRACGVDPMRAEELVRAVLDGTRPEGAVVVDVTSARRRHGRLVALLADQHPADEARARLVTEWARHAGEALELTRALASTRREAARTSALLELAHALAASDDTDEVAGVVARAVPRVVGSDAVVMLWDEAARRLRTGAAVGVPDATAEGLAGLSLAPEELPELARTLVRREPADHAPSSASPELAHLLAEFGWVRLLAVPLVAGDDLVGVVASVWSEDLPDAERAAALERLVAVTEQAGTAVQNARLRQTLRHAAGHDALTGLPNRALFNRHLDTALRAAGPDDGTCVLVVDLDRFKAVNAAHGQLAGDELLRQVAARLAGVVRGSDLVARLSADEFAVLLVDMEEPEAVRAAQRLVARLGEPFRVGGHEVRVTASVGVSVQVGTDGRGERMLAEAGRAMGIAKEQGRNQVVVGDAADTTTRVPSLEAELARAVEQGQLRLFFQPLVAVDDGRTAVVGAEALLRWAHPRLGLLSPAAFLPLAEEAELIPELDLWAVEAACRTLGEALRAGRDLRVAVNLSVATLTDPRLVPTVRASLARWEVDACRLHLEVVESRSLMDLGGVVEAMHELRDAGVRLSLDDFGTGYSTLSWLHSLPVDQIKIDRSFVMRMPSDDASAAVVRGVIALAREMRIEAVAEGVEESAQLDALRAAGCRLVQGYLLGRPGPLIATDVATATPA